MSCERWTIIWQNNIKNRQTKNRVRRTGAGSAVWPTITWQRWKHMKECTTLTNRTCATGAAFPTVTTPSCKHTALNIKVATFLLIQNWKNLHNNKLHFRLISVPGWIWSFRRWKGLQMRVWSCFFEILRFVVSHAPRRRAPNRPCGLRRGFLDQGTCWRSSERQNASLHVGGRTALSQFPESLLLSILLQGIFSFFSEIPRIISVIFRCILQSNLFTAKVFLIFAYNIKNFVWILQNPALEIILHAWIISHLQKNW